MESGRQHTCLNKKNNLGVSIAVADKRHHSKRDRSKKDYSMGAFSHSAGTAPIIMLFIPGAPLKTTHLHKCA